MPTELIEAPVTTPTEEGDHERFSHIILEGWKPEEGDFVPVGNSVIEGTIYGTPVKALCGKVWVPGRNPARFPICPSCKEIAISHGWAVPSA